MASDVTDGGIRLRLYSRAWCHLCQDMQAGLEALRGQPGVPDFKVAVFDVDADPALEARYDELVPVLTDDQDQELCHYHLDLTRVMRFFSEQETRPSLSAHP